MNALMTSCSSHHAGSMLHAQTVQVNTIAWHVERMGKGPPCVLLHGTGSSAHSWHALMPLLADHMTLYAIDLPGHGRTSIISDEHLSLDGMTQQLRGLLDHLGLSPVIGVGHSAGAAILLQLGLRQPGLLTQVISINGALVPFDGIPGILFPRLAQLSAGSNLIQELFVRRLSRPHRVNRLLTNTGSTIDPRSMMEYHRLCRNPIHVRSALTMMANWRLEALYARLHCLNMPVTLIVSDDDPMVPPRQAHRAASRLPAARLRVLSGGGHLVHEACPQRVAEEVLLAMSATPPPTPPLTEPRNSHGIVN